jgi:hypothetical protein
MQCEDVRAGKSKVKLHSREQGSNQCNPGDENTRALSPRIVSLTGPWVRPILVQRADDDGHYGLLQAIEFVGADLLMDVISGP